MDTMCRILATSRWLSSVSANSSATDIAASSSSCPFCVVAAADAAADVAVLIVVVVVMAVSCVTMNCSGAAQRDQDEHVAVLGAV